MPIRRATRRSTAIAATERDAIAALDAAIAALDGRRGRRRASSSRALKRARRRRRAARGLRHAVWPGRAGAASAGSRSGSRNADSLAYGEPCFAVRRNRRRSTCTRLEFAVRGGRCGRGARRRPGARRSTLALGALHDELGGAGVAAFVLEHGRLWSVGVRGYAMIPDGLPLDEGVIGRAVRTSEIQLVRRRRCRSGLHRGLARRPSRSSRSRCAADGSRRCDQHRDGHASRPAASAAASLRSMDGSGAEPMDELRAITHASICRRSRACSST